MEGGRDKRRRGEVREEKSKDDIEAGGCLATSMHELLSEKCMRLKDEKKRIHYSKHISITDILVSKYNLYTTHYTVLLTSNM